MSGRPSELERLVRAREDIESASAAWALLAGWAKLEASELPGFGRVDWEAARVAIWTGAVVSYSRPFTDSPYRVSGRWERFREEPDLKRLHELVVRELRHKLFAHTDETPLREVVMPGRSRAGDGSSAFGSVRHIVRFRQLCDFQLARLGPRVAELEA